MALENEGGQMAVELAVLMPVVIVVALIVFNLCRFVELCAVFDRASLDAIASYGVSSEGEQSVQASKEEIRVHLAEAVGNEDSCSIDVRSEGLSGEGSGAVFVISPLLTRYTCELSYRPWPASLVIGGIEGGVPLALHHERSLVVDRFRPGVVV